MWTSEPFSRGQAWIDLLLLAAHNKSFFYIRGNKVDVKRGQLAWSESKLSERWRWSRSKLRKFLIDLEKERQIEQYKGGVIQVITIVNYNKYQEKEPQTVQQKDDRKTTEKHIQECKEQKECKESKEEIPTYSEFKDYAISKKPNVNTEALQFKYEAWKINNWKDGNDKQIKNWKSKLLNTLPHIKEQRDKFHPSEAPVQNLLT